MKPHFHFPTAPIHPANAPTPLRALSAGLWIALARAVRLLLPLLLLLTLPAVVQAQFNYTTNNGTITITGYTGPGGAVTIPSTINGLPVTSIGDYAFQVKRNLTSVAIPNSVTNIGATAYANCYSLTNVTIQNSATSIGGGAFGICSSLASVALGNSVTSIGDDAFAYCTSLTSITIPNSVTSIWGKAFLYCTSLTGLYFYGNAPSVDWNVFEGADAVTVYYLPGTTGWGATFASSPTALWVLPYPLILRTGAGFGVQTNGFGFIISWATNSSVVVEACTDLSNPVWTSVNTNTLTGGSSYFSDPQWTNHPTRFYRLVSPVL